LEHQALYNKVTPDEGQSAAMVADSVHTQMSGREANMEPASIINLGLLGVTAVATLLSIFSAVDARNSREKSAESQRRALGAAESAAASLEDSASSQGRAAAALEQANELAAARETVPEPWEFEQQKNKHVFKFTNRTGALAEFVQVTSSPGDIQLDGLEENSDLPKGHGFILHFGGTITDPAYTNIKIVWRGADKEGHEWSTTVP
jgi:type II secretory pathway pseudopilin PulG